jgi:hypothetical protein
VSAQNTSIPVSQTPGRLRKTYNKPCTYNSVRRLIADGLIEAERVGSRLYIYEHQIPEIARALGMIGPTAPTARTARRPSAA